MITMPVTTLISMMMLAVLLMLSPVLLSPRGLTIPLTLAAATTTAVAAAAATTQAK